MNVYTAFPSVKKKSKNNDLWLWQSHWDYRNNCYGIQFTLLVYKTICKEKGCNK